MQQHLLRGGWCMQHKEEGGSPNSGRHFTTIGDVHTQTSVCHQEAATAASGNCPGRQWIGLWLQYTPRVAERVWAAVTGVPQAAVHGGVHFQMDGVQFETDGVCFCSMCVSRSMCHFGEGHARAVVLVLEERGPQAGCECVLVVVVGSNVAARWGPHHLLILYRCCPLWFDLNALVTVMLSKVSVKWCCLDMAAWPD